MDENFYRYFIGREDQSVHEDVMIRRIDQQLLVNRLMVDTIAGKKISNKHLRQYMLRYLDIITTVSSVMLIRSGTEENLNKKKDLWKYIKNADIKEIAEIKIDKTQAGKTVEEIEETDFVSIYLIFRDDLSILPQKDTMLKLNDIIIIRDGN